MHRRNGSKRENLLSVFVRKKPADLFLAISNGNGDNHYSRLAVKARCTYSHTLGLLEKMRGAGLLTFERQGRAKKAKLTDKGIEISKSLKKVMDILKHL